MAQPHKGDRRLINTRVAIADWREIAARAHATGTSVSQYVADLVADHVATTESPDTAGTELITRLEVTQLSKSA